MQKKEYPGRELKSIKTQRKLLSVPSTFGKKGLPRVSPLQLKHVELFLSSR